MTLPRPFRFGAAVASASSRADWVALARHVEALGYSTLLVPDHYVTEFPPAVALMAAADAAQTLRVGSLVFDNDFRHPGQLAKEVATLDLLSDGRFELGIGAGWNLDDYAPLNLPFDSASIRIDRLAESIAILKQFFTQDSVTFAGTHYQVQNLPAVPHPVQRPHPPIFIGGGGKRLLTLAGQQADIVGLHFKVNADGIVDATERTADAVERKLGWVRQAAGDRFPAIELNILLSAVVTDSPEQAAQEVARERNTTPDAVYADPYMFIGTIEQLVEKAQRLRDHHGISYIAVRRDAIDTFAPVVARLAGK